MIFQFYKKWEYTMTILNSSSVWKFKISKFQMFKRSVSKSPSVQSICFQIPKLQIVKLPLSKVSKFISSKVSQLSKFQHFRSFKDSMIPYYLISTSCLFWSILISYSRFSRSDKMDFKDLSARVLPQIAGFWISDILKYYSSK